MLYSPHNKKIKIKVMNRVSISNQLVKENKINLFNVIMNSPVSVVDDMGYDFKGFQSLYFEGDMGVVNTIIDLLGLPKSANQKAKGSAITGYNIEIA